MICEGSYSYCQIGNFVNLQFSANIHEGTIRILCHIVRHVYNYADIKIYKDKMLT